MKLNDMPPLFAKRKLIPEEEMAALYVEATVAATHEQMLLFRMQLAPYLNRTKRIDTYINTVLVYASGNHQYNRRIQEFEAQWRRNLQRS